MHQPIQVGGVNKDKDRQKIRKTFRDRVLENLFSEETLKNVKQRIWKRIFNEYDAEEVQQNALLYFVEHLSTIYTIREIYKFFWFCIKREIFNHIQKEEHESLTSQILRSKLRFTINRTEPESLSSDQQILYDLLFENVIKFRSLTSAINETAEQLNCSRATIYRRIQEIRNQVEKELRKKENNFIKENRKCRDQSKSVR